MKVDDLMLLLKKEVSDRGVNWYVGMVAGVIFIQGIQRTISNDDNLASIDFINGKSRLNLLTKDEGIQRIITAMYEKFRHKVDFDPNQEESGLKNILSTIIIGAIITLCVLVPVLSYLVFNLFQIK